MFAGTIYDVQSDDEIVYIICIKFSRLHGCYYIFVLYLSYLLYINYCRNYGFEKIVSITN